MQERRCGKPFGQKVTRMKGCLRGPYRVFLAGGFPRRKASLRAMPSPCARSSLRRGRAIRD
jgi:hypothetical protein